MAAADLRGLSVPARCPKCSHLFAEPMSPAYGRDLVACVLAALAGMKTVQLPGGTRVNDG